MTNCIACKDIEQLTVGARNDGTSKGCEVTIHFDYPRCKESLLYVRLPSGITTSYNEHDFTLSLPLPPLSSQKQNLGKGSLRSWCCDPSTRWLLFFLSPQSLPRYLGTLAFIKPPPNASKEKIVLAPHSTLAIVYCGKKREKKTCPLHDPLQLSILSPFFLRTLGVSSM